MADTPKQPEDIFADVDAGGFGEPTPTPQPTQEPPAALQPASPLSLEESPQPLLPELPAEQLPDSSIASPATTNSMRNRVTNIVSRVSMKKVLIAMIILAVVLAIALVIAGATQQRDDTVTQEESPQPQPIQVDDSGAVVQEPTRPDTDGDGLYDDEEAEYRTDPNSVDTDGDGINDRQEILYYETDPRNPDTDYDGFTDGEEVRNYYNPNGKGKFVGLDDIETHSSPNN